MTKRIISLFLTIAIMASLMVFAAVPGFAVFDGGDGTQDNPYLISTAAQLHEFRDLVNGGNAKLCAQLTNNIDLGGENWTPIGLSSSGYNGVFDGSGYAIRNLFVYQHRRHDRMGYRSFRYSRQERHGEESERGRHLLHERQAAQGR